MADPVIVIRDLVKTFSTSAHAVCALNHFSGEIKAGQITGLVGPDGAGKTTLMRLITGLLEPDSGEIEVLGLNANRQAQEIQAHVGYMPQRFGLYEDLTVAHNLSLYADLQGLPKNQRGERFEQLMNFTGLAPFQKRLAGRLSGGMKQKLGLACSLVRPPRLLLLDEPSVGVDPLSRLELWDIVSTLVEQGISVLWSTAYLDEAEKCPDVILLNEGQTLYAGPPRQLSEQIEGRSMAFPLATVDKRTVLENLMALPFVMDTAIKGREVHVLLAEAINKTDLNTLMRVASTTADSIKTVFPTFEDAFIALLHEQQESPDADQSENKSLHGQTGDSPSKNKNVAASDGTPSKDRNTGENAEVVIRVEGLVRRFGNFNAVDGIDFSVKRGEIFGLLGPNGAGKSTTFKMLCGLLPPSDGQALVLGIDLRHARAIARSRIGYMAQKFSLYGNMSVMQNLQFFASAYGLTGQHRKKMIENELTEFNLHAYAGANSADLPLGYKQRLAMACAIMHEPGILFLDEPTSGVDPLVRREFWRRVNTMAAAGVTIMVTTHFMEEVEYCDRIAIIYRGKLIATGTPEDLKKDQATDEFPHPTIEQAFSYLVENYDREHQQ